MTRSKVTFVLCVAAAAILTLIGQAWSQSRPAVVWTTGGGDSNEMRARMEDFRKQAQQRLKESLGASDDEWKILEPKIEKVQQLSRDARGGMGFMMGRGIMVNGVAMRAFGDDPNRPKTDIETTAETMRTVLDNKDSKPEEIKAALAAYRDAKAKIKADLDKAQKDLKDVLTARQEALLVMMGTLD